MLFITNRALNEGKTSPQPGKERKITFNLNDSEPSSSVFFCERRGKEKHFEIGSKKFLEQLRDAKEKQILLYIHGFNNLPERDIFPRARSLQTLCDQARKDLIKVVPLIWPCDNDMGIIKDYWDDQESADQSAFGFVRVLGKFLEWRSAQRDDDDKCYKRINVLAHSMGNRVLRLTMERWGTYYGTVPQIFRNTFMVAADVVNETLEYGEAAISVCNSARNVVVYYAGDDLALRGSKVANVKNKVFSRRLGHTGPEDMGDVPNNVYAVDCDNFNNTYDKPKGHTYFLRDDRKEPGAVFRHMFHALITGRVDVVPGTRFRELPRRGYKPPKWAA